MTLNLKDTKKGKIRFWSKRESSIFDFGRKENGTILEENDYG